VQGVVNQAMEYRLQRLQRLVPTELDDDVVEEHFPLKQRGSGR
jgi:hypothetical protein